MKKSSTLTPIILAVLALCLCVESASEVTCVPYTGTVCASRIPAGTLVLPQLGAVAYTESYLLLSLGFSNLTLVGGAIDPVCVEAALNYVCAFAFANCTWNPATNQTGRRI